MPYRKCVTCKIRVSGEGSGMDPRNASCPGCGQSLEPVANLADVLGYRSSNPHDSPVPPRAAERVADISGGQAAAEADLDADRWLGEGGSLSPEALAEAVALPRLRTGP